MVLTFDKCCCCIDLRVGSLILGYVQLVGVAIYTLLVFLGIVGLNYAIAHEAEQKAKDVLFIAVIILYVVLPFLIMALVFTLLLVIGIHKDKAGFVKAFLIYDLIFMIIGVIFFIVTVATGPADVVSILRTLISLALSIYFLLVLNSYYQVMKEGRPGAPKGGIIYSA